MEIENTLMDGPIGPEFIAKNIAEFHTQKDTGAHDIFLGQVRADEINGKTVDSIDYSAHTEMANTVFNQIKEEAFRLYNIKSLRIYHSIGEVKAGEICLLVIASSGHRKEARTALNYVVERIKSEVPVFGREIFSDRSHVWKVNK